MFINNVNVNFMNLALKADMSVVNEVYHAYEIADSKPEYCWLPELKNKADTIEQIGFARISVPCIPIDTALIKFLENHKMTAGELLRGEIPEKRGTGMIPVPQAISDLIGVSEVSKNDFRLALVLFRAICEKEHGVLTVSAMPSDILMASTHHAYDETSCYRIGGEFEGSVTSYANNPCTLVAFVTKPLPDNMGTERVFCHVERESTTGKTILEECPMKVGRVFIHADFERKELKGFIVGRTYGVFKQDKVYIALQKLLADYVSKAKRTDEVWSKISYGSFSYTYNDSNVYPDSMTRYFGLQSRIADIENGEIRKPFLQVTQNVCIECGEDFSDGEKTLSCPECRGLEECENCHDTAKLMSIFIKGSEYQLCDYCFENYVSYCECCEENCWSNASNLVTIFFPSGEKTRCLCDDCLANLHHCEYCNRYSHGDECLNPNCIKEQCSVCGRYHGNCSTALNAGGNELPVCPDCFKKLTRCSLCGERHLKDAKVQEGVEFFDFRKKLRVGNVCPRCFETLYLCSCCGSLSDFPVCRNETCVQGRSSLLSESVQYAENCMESGKAGVRI